MQVVATYATPEQARAALAMLERHGVEASDIELRGPGVEPPAPVTNDEQRRADLGVAGAMVRRVVPVGILGAVVGLFVGLALSLLVFDGEGGALVGSAIGGLIVGTLLGSLFGGYTGLPVNEQWSETFGTDGGETTLVLLCDDPAHVDSAVHTLRRTHAQRVDIA